MIRARHGAARLAIDGVENSREPARYACPTSFPGTLILPPTDQTSRERDRNSRTTSISTLSLARYWYCKTDYVAVLFSVHGHEACWGKILTIIYEQEAAHSFNSGHLKLSDCFICFYMNITPLTEIRFHISHKFISVQQFL